MQVLCVCGTKIVTNIHTDVSSHFLHTILLPNTFRVLELWRREVFQKQGCGCVWWQCKGFQHSSRHISLLSPLHTPWITGVWDHCMFLWHDSDGSSRGQIPEKIYNIHSFILGWFHLWFRWSWDWCVERVYSAENGLFVHSKKPLQLPFKKHNIFHLKIWDCFSEKGPKAFLKSIWYSKWCLHVGCLQLISYTLEIGTSLFIMTWIFNHAHISIVCVNFDVFSWNNL